MKKSIDLVAHSETTVSQTNSERKMDLKSDHVLEKQKQQYIRYKANKGGLANNLFGMVSAYVIAEILNATLVCKILLLL